MLCCCHLYSIEHHHIHSGSFKKLRDPGRRGGGRKKPSKCSTNIPRWTIQVSLIGWRSLGME